MKKYLAPIAMIASSTLLLSGCALAGLPGSDMFNKDKDSDSTAVATSEAPATSTKATTSRSSSTRTSSAKSSASSESSTKTTEPTMSREEKEKNEEILKEALFALVSADLPDVRKGSASGTATFSRDGKFEGITNYKVNGESKEPSPETITRVKDILNDYKMDEKKKFRSMNFTLENGFLKAQYSR
ncbi:hypothetical protein QVA66_03635 [Staphylococcus chromogenes]|nr:hypothetical protein [Staphylococcus chromogenes]